MVRAVSPLDANGPLVSIVVPVHDEAATIRANVEVLLAYLRHDFPLRYEVVIADNASTDATRDLARGLAAEHDEVELVAIDRKGGGAALKRAWGVSNAEVLCYMDVDLSTNLESLSPLVMPLCSGQHDVAIGTRLAHQAHVQRRLKREILSRGYNLVVRTLFHVGFSDAQCGF